MKNFGENPRDFTAPTTKTETTTASSMEAAIDDWDKPFTSEELEAIEAIFAAAESALSSPVSPSSSSFKITRRISSSGDDDADGRPRTRRRLPGSITCSDGEVGSGQKSGPFALLPCSSNRPLLYANRQMKYPVMNFGGRIVYCRTVQEVEEATLQILNLLEVKKQELGRAILGVDIEWKPSFGRGIPQGKAAVLQICGDMTRCYVLHIIHSGVPHNLKSLLEDPTSIKVGVGIDGDAVKMFHDHNVSIKSVKDLSSLANQKLGGVPKQWSLSSLVETLTSKQAQLEYAATDAFASWYLYEVLHSFPDLSEHQNKD
ncbi:hypothetical protein Cgig2_001322 [Carnegiea gigantea]|uniref:3'-5' exonuclease n=1 Tax=Carnegiea gigantea TaxID=171969 RepID=A0A9Q1KRS1_9CARY|nr:hypothetical protein Cgig2_001322 [Carnegiea gigantea]